MGANQSTIETSAPFESLPEDWPWVWAIRDVDLLDWRRGRSLDEIESHASRQQDLPVPITENVFLGDAESVESVERLEARGITAVLNMAGPRATSRETVQAYGRKGISYKCIFADDEPDYPLLQNHWKVAFEFIRSSTANDKGKCVVHCMAGMNRSGLIVAAYYMAMSRTPVLETVKHIRTQRGNVTLCNEGFQQQLVALARNNDLLGTKPGTGQSIVQQHPPPAKYDLSFSKTLHHQ